MTWCSTFSLAGALLILLPNTALSLVIVRVELSRDVASVGDSVEVEIRADLSDPIVGWGLDLILDPGVLSVDGPPSIGGAWTGVFAPDGDELAGLAFPTGVSGTDVLLATLHHQVAGVGATTIVPSVTSGDLTEGFALEVTGFDDIVFEAATFTAVPEPRSLRFLLAATALGFGISRAGSTRTRDQEA